MANNSPDRETILSLVGSYGQNSSQPQTFVPGTTPIPASGKVLGAEEYVAMADAVLDGWLTTGRFNTSFQKQLGEFIGVEYVLTTNSGSSANLLALTSLTSPKLGERRLKPGDEIITVAAGFPTTINPILQNGLVPVFVDVDIPTYNAKSGLIEAAITSKTKAIMLAHTLGNPYDLDSVKSLCSQHKLWLIEDCCDALGSEYHGQKVGTFGDLATLSFYPAHHITMGEGGAVLTKSKELQVLVESFRDWGRDCYCDPGKENTCGKRFGWQLGQLPEGYDHKYTYSHRGYNLKITDIQAACGLAQLNRLPGFIQTRKNNFNYLRKKLLKLREVLILPEATPNSDPSWFGFPITLKESTDTNRKTLMEYLGQNKIGTRLLFAGNVTRQPYFESEHYRIAGNLDSTDTIMNNTFWIGVYPGLDQDMLDYVVEQLELYFGVGF